MRLQLNLNTYYEGLGMEHVNAIFRMMMDMQPTVDKLEFLYYKCTSEDLAPDTEAYKVAAKFNEATLLFRVRQLDNYMKELGREPIFGCPNFERDEGTFGGETYKEAIRRYRFLMSEPQEV